MTNHDVNQRPIRRALISTANKMGLVEFASYLAKHQIEIIATGGTAKLLQQHQIPVIEIADYTGFPEILEGRVKTLHPKIHGGLLARPVNDDAILQKYDISRIDLLIVNLYPFAQTIADPNCSFEAAIEQIDVGGPSMLRGAAKNFAAVTAIIDPADYALIMKEMDNHHGATTLATRHYLAAKIFSSLATYDATIASYLSGKTAKLLPESLSFQFQKKTDLRYGENPHQAAAVYTNLPPIKHSLADVEPLQGKSLSYNNLIDSDCAYRCVYELSQPACVIVKHATPCGAAIAKTQLAAYEKAYATDPTSAFGGIIAFNTPLEIDTAKKILAQQFVEVIIAPDFSTEVQKLFHAKPDIRLLACETIAHDFISLHTIPGGLLAQQTDHAILQTADLQIVSKRQPSATEIQDLLFAWPIVKYVKSNAIVYAKNGATLGIGGGQTSRVFSAKIAAMKAEEANLSLKNAVMASDAFFPFADSIEIAAQAGITAIIQPGGSKRDAEVIAAADKANIAMVFTGQRHFRH
jgi:phosphoribosylaminoimidazolecarboxamide formyltransferase/IMP cyclohydrolase